MDSRQFTVGGVMFETHAPTVRSRLAQKRLNTLFYTNWNIQADGDNDDLWDEVLNFTEFLTTTRVVTGDEPDYMVNPKSDFGVLETAFNALMDAGEAVYDNWFAANRALILPSGTPELSPQTDPNASAPQTKNADTTS